MSDPKPPPEHPESSRGGPHILGILGVLACVSLIIGPCVDVLPETNATYYVNAQPLHLSWWRAAAEDLPGYLAKRAAWLEHGGPGGELDIPALGAHAPESGSGMVLTLAITRDPFPQIHHDERHRHATIYIPQGLEQVRNPVPIPGKVQLLYSEFSGSAANWERHFLMGFATDGEIEVWVKDARTLTVSIDATIPLYQGSEGSLEETLSFKKTFAYGLDTQALHGTPTVPGRQRRTLLHWPLGATGSGIVQEY